jgi:hypothetical protein
VKLGGGSAARSEASGTEERSEARSLRDGRGRRGGRGSRENAAPVAAAPQETEQPREERAERSRRPARNDRPRNDGHRGGADKPAREPGGQHVEGIVADSPFGSDGPIPAFLLRK